MMRLFLYIFFAALLFLFSKSVYAGPHSISAFSAEDGKLISIGSDKSVNDQTDSVQQPQYLRLQFFKDSVNSEQTTVRFISQDATDTTIYNEDHFAGFSGVSFYSLSGNNESLDMITAKLPGKKSTVIRLYINASTSGTYQLKLRNLVAIPPLDDIWLMDAYKKDSLNLRTGPYSLDINKADSTSFGSGRLTLVIRQNPALAYQLLDFTANKTQAGRNVEVLWKTKNEENNTNFTVERSTGVGKTFDGIGVIKSSGIGSYSFIDKNSGSQTNFYRLKQQDQNNDITYSKMVEVQSNNYNALEKLRIFPNPATQTINLSIGETDDQNGNYSIRLMNSSGLIVGQFTSSQPQWQGSIGNLRPGSYLVRVINIKTQSLVGENKFVKL